MKAKEETGVTENSPAGDGIDLGAAYPVPTAHVETLIVRWF